MTSHKQTWIKANTHVDNGVANLVGALCQFACLRTIESCQQEPPQGPWVCFEYGEDGPEGWRDLAEFVLGYFGGALYRQVGDRATVSIVIGGGGRPHAELSVRDGAAQLVSREIRNLARGFSQRGRP